MTPVRVPEPLSAAPDLLQGMPAAPEPSEEELKGAIWVVLGVPSQAAGPMGAPPSIAGKLTAHLKVGGSAMVLTSPQAEDMSPALADYGIKGLDNPYLSTGLAGVAGVLVTFLVGAGFFWVVRRRGPRNDESVGAGTRTGADGT